MSWRDQALRHFPDVAFPDTPPRAKRPTVPTLEKKGQLGTVGTLARLSVSENAGLPPPSNRQYDAHVSDWYDWNERAAIIEFEGYKQRAEAEREAILLYRS